MEIEEEEDQNSSPDEDDPSNSDKDFDEDDSADADFSGDASVADGAEDSSVLITDDAETKSANVAALVRGSLVVKRQALLPRVLSVSVGASFARKPFKPPCSEGYDSHNEELRRRLWTRKRFIPWRPSMQASVPATCSFDLYKPVGEDGEEEDISLPPGVEPLILWQPEGAEDGDCGKAPIVVEALLSRYLRPHQREGVQFMFECISGLLSNANICGCILADDMGLGKTLQSIALLYTLLRQGFDGKAMVKKAIIVTPTSLVSNWEAEIKKWVGEKLWLLALCESSRDDVITGIISFVSPLSNLQVLIVSYETFRLHSQLFGQSGSCDLLICDEAHRLKNDQTITNRALATLPCKRRILLSGTPMQRPIICGREPTATEEQKKLGLERSLELSAKVNQFILRRSNALLSNHLPPKIIEVVCCRLSPLQLRLYNHFIQSKNVERVLTGNAKQSKILEYITALKKLCNHPKLIYDTVRNTSSGSSGFDDCIRFFPHEMFSSRSGAWVGGDGLWVELSGKMQVLARLLAHLQQKTDDRIVLVSNYTQTLDLFAQLCRERRYPFLRLDGSTSISKRQKLVNSFNDPSKDEFAFLLSSKAGGCGLNLIGGNRLVLFDPDWNPANDKQAAARVWRDGQKKRVYIYRFLSTGTIEEKVYQRQMSKEGLQKVIQQEQADCSKGNFFSMEDLTDLFTFQENVRSEIHDKMNCSRCRNNASLDESQGNVRKAEQLASNGSDLGDLDIGGFAEVAGCLQRLQSSERQVGSPLEEDLGNWGHHITPMSVPDSALQVSAGDEVSFVFTNQVEGKLVPVESVCNQKQGMELEKNTTESSKKLKPNSLVQCGGHTGRSILAYKSPRMEAMIQNSAPFSDRTNFLARPKLSISSKLPMKRLLSHILTDGDSSVVKDEQLFECSGLSTTVCSNTSYRVIYCLQKTTPELACHMINTFSKATLLYVKTCLPSKVQHQSHFIGYHHDPSMLKKNY